MIKTLIRVTPIGLPSAIAFALLLYMSLSSDPVGASMLSFPGADKVAHFLMYLLCTLVYISDALRFRMPHHVKFGKMAAIATASAVLGLLLEVLQLQVNRDFDLIDEVANAAGAFTALLLVKFWLQHQFRVLMMGEYLRHQKRKKHRRHSRSHHHSHQSLENYNAEKHEEIQAEAEEITENPHQE